MPIVIYILDGQAIYTAAENVDAQPKPNDADTKSDKAAGRLDYSAGESKPDDTISVSSRNILQKTQGEDRRRRT